MSENASADDPALYLNGLIGKFNRLVDDAGAWLDVLPPTDTTGSNLLVALHTTLNRQALTKLRPLHAELLDVVAEMIAYTDNESYFESCNLPGPPELDRDIDNNLRALVQFAASMEKGIKPLVEAGLGTRNNNRLLHLVNKKKREQNKGFYYEFSDGDLKRIQTLLNELRDQVNNSAVFDDSHRDRVLRRLEALQAELHKRMGNVDRFWGLVGDAGVVIGKFGQDSKPIVDRIKELSQIVWRTQARAEELPSGSENPLLGYDGEDAG